jgi:hypothetical protein
MTYRTRTYYTDGQKALMWERWKEGWTLHRIGKLFDRAHTSVQGNELQTRYVMLVKVAGQEAKTRRRSSMHSSRTRKLPQELYKSLTWDRGKEMAGHKRFTLATDIQVYFCDPRSPWQRGSNENTNGLLRQYLPKGIDISSYSQAKLNAVARQLNERPTKTLGYQAPAEMFSQTVALNLIRLFALRRRKSADGRQFQCASRSRQTGPAKFPPFVTPGPTHL